MDVVSKAVLLTDGSISGIDVASLNIMDTTERNLPMTYTELMTTIRESDVEDWRHSDIQGIFTHRLDLDIRIERCEPLEHELDFKEEWANCHPDSSASRCYFDIFYRSSWVETFMLVSVDGHRATLPLPKAGTKTVSVDAYRLAAQVDTDGTLDEYMQRSGLEVAGAVAATM